jgi:outer membrane protein assembly factor BamB
VGQIENFPVEWKPENIRWQIDLPGVGHSSPVLWGNKLFLTSGDEATGTRFILCVDTTAGKIAWTKQFVSRQHPKHKLNSFASATPVVDAQRLYVTWATPEEYLVLTLDHEGKELWRKNVGTFRAGHGSGVSPIVYEDLLIVPNEQDADSSVMALDRATGELRWQVSRDSKASYSTPCIYQGTTGEAELILTSWTNGITALRPSSGEKLWELDTFDKSHIETAIGSPIVAGELIVGVCGWLGHGNEIVAVRPGRAETEAAELVYRIDRTAPLCTTPVAHEGLLFLWTDAGIAACADAVTGEIHWRERIGGNYYSSPIIVNDSLLNISTTGEVTVLAAAQKFQRLSKYELGEGSHSTSAVAGGVLYLRTFTKLFAVGEE